MASEKRRAITHPVIASSRSVGALLCCAVLVLTACTGNYRAGVQEWAQPTRELLAQRVDEAIEAQDEAIEGLEQLPRTQPVAGGEDLYHQQVSLSVYQYGQSVQAIRDVLDRAAQTEPHPEDRQPLRKTPVAQLADDLHAVQRMMEDYLEQQPHQQTDAVETITLAQLQQAARNARADARAMMGRLR